MANKTKGLICIIVALVVVAIVTVMQLTGYNNPQWFVTIIAYLAALWVIVTGIRIMRQ